MRMQMQRSPATIIFLVIIFQSLIVTDAIYYAPVVRVRSGRVRGEVHTIPYSTPVYAYKGIPYGQAKRFEKAIWPKPWAGVLNGTHFRDACPQPDLQPTENGVTPFGLPVNATTTTMSEDCLFLSVYRPRPNFVHDVMLGGMIIPMRTVMVYFVGGGGSGSTSDPRGTIFSQLADASHLSSRGDVVVVTVQSRVGPFGYLYGGTKEAPGNVGLHDQILALRWIWYNIGTFSGDRTQVTIFGQGGGAVSVGAMILSPLNWRLFRRAILQSGSPLSPVTGPTSKKQALKRTMELAAKLDCTSTKGGEKKGGGVSTKNIEVTLECLRSKTVQEIVDASKVEGFSSGHSLFRPIYGDDLLPGKPSKVLTEGKFNLGFDLLYGTVKDEGADFAAAFVPAGADSANPLTVESVKETLKWMMVFYGQSYGEEVAEFYTSESFLNESSTREDMRRVIASAWADFSIVCPTILFAEAYAKKSPRHYYYAYRLDQPFSYPLSASSSNGSSSSGLDYRDVDSSAVHHGSDVMYLFAGPTDKRFTQANLKLSKDMHYAWTSFAKNGWVRGWYGKIAWAKAFEKPLEPETKVISLNAEDYRMMPASLYGDTCRGFWARKLMPEANVVEEDEGDEKEV